MSELVDERIARMAMAKTYADAYVEGRIAGLKDAMEVARTHPESPEGGYGGLMRSAELATANGIADKIQALIDGE
jgi:hypothetical protein